METTVKRKLSTKFTLGFLLLAIVISASTCIIGYFKYKDTIQQMYNETAYMIADIATSYVDGDKMEEYLISEKTDEAYHKMEEEINLLRESSSANYIFLSRPNEDLTLDYIFDALSGNPKIHQMQLGDTDPMNPDNAGDVFDIFMTGNKSDSYFISKSEFGYNTSAITPITDSEGKVTALLSVDISMSLIQSAMEEYILNVILVSAILISLFIFGYLRFLRKTVILPIDKVTQSAVNFLESDHEVSTSLSSIKTKDEIQILAESLVKMQLDINQYIKDLTMVTAEKERISTELHVATQIQSSMLPCIFPAFPDREEFDIYATMQPAKEVGGDFYDFFLIDDNNLAVVIADVSGKGVPAALFMVITKTLIKNHTQLGESPANVFTNTNRQLCENNEADMFVTAWMGVLEIDTGKLTFVNAGHNPPLLKKSDGQFEYLKSSAGFVLAGMEGIRYKENEIYLEEGDTLFLYTDGVTEATDTQNELYGEPRLQSIVNENRKLKPEYLLNCVIKDIDDFVQIAPQFDDITMLAIMINDSKVKANSKDFENEKTLSFPAQITEIPKIIDFVEKFLDQYNVPLDVKMQIDIAIDELVSNIAKFAYSGDDGDVTVFCSINNEEESFKLILADKGMAYNPLELAEPDITLSAEDRKIGGLGVFMVKKIMDEIKYEYKDSGNVLTLEKMIR